MRSLLAVDGRIRASGLCLRTRNGHEGCFGEAWDGSEECVVDSGELLGGVLGYLG